MAKPGKYLRKASIRKDLENNKLPDLRSQSNSHKFNQNT